MTNKQLIKQALVAAIYVALVVTFSWMSYGDIQFRIAEILLVLVLFDTRYKWGILVGTFIANLLSPLGIVDWIVGTLATFITIELMIRIKKPFVALLIPALINGLIVGLELTWIFKLPFFMTFLSVFFGEFVVVSIFGSGLYPLLKNHTSFQKVIEL